MYLDRSINFLIKEFSRNLKVHKNLNKISARRILIHGKRDIIIFEIHD